jgi:hypothetical protein
MLGVENNLNATLILLFSLFLSHVSDPEYYETDYSNMIAKRETPTLLSSALNLLDFTLPMK